LAANLGRRDPVRLRDIVFAGGLLTAGLFGFAPTLVAAAEKPKPALPAISEEANAALLRMGHTLGGAEHFAFQARTIRVYSDIGGQPLHIFHTLKIVVQRPNRLFAQVIGDDGTNKLVFDGKTAYIFSVTHNKYAKIPVPDGTIEGMLKEAVGRLGVDFPLADFLTATPNKAFLTGVNAGHVVDTVTIDGAPYLHLFFSQPPGIELELWVSKNEQSLPSRLIVTYRMLPGEPNFIAEFSDWAFDVRSSDTAFVFQPPAGAVEVALKPVAPPPPTKRKGAR
jgi:hypothetical protein